MFESLPTIPIAALYAAGKDALGSFRNRKLNRNVKLLELRQRWRPQFEARVAEYHRRQLRTDVIICDLRRLDEMPHDPPGVGISASFRVGLIQANQRGILVHLRFLQLGKHSDGEHWRMLKSGERGDVFRLAGFIPYEVIDSVDWQGDEYRDSPHIYCRFDFNHEPYQHLAFYSEHQHPHPEGPPYYTEIATFDEVRRFSPQTLDDVPVLSGIP